ncbi:hypothetical protein D3C76_1628860 [compost metagenome]
MRIANRPVLHVVTHPFEVVIEAAVESDLQLHACLLHSRHSRLGLSQIHTDRLLAENMLARLRRLFN